jgi:hypothetical protein
MKIPDWVQKALLNYENRTEPFFEVEVAEALAAVRKNEGDLNEEDWKGFLAERAAFLFGDRRAKDSVWNTYFSPMMSGKKNDGADFHAPDIRELDMSAVSHWESRAKACSNPVMRARYADLVWDLKHAITGEKPHPEYARIATDAYVEAAAKGLYKYEVGGIAWLGRALDLSRSINDTERINSVVQFMFDFYDRVAQFKFAGTWLFLFDNLYGEKIITPAQEARIISNLEGMLAKASDATRTADGVYPTLDPWSAEAAAERLAKHYRKPNDRANVERVVKAYGTAFEHMAGQANPMMATVWLQPVIERYEQEGLKADAEKLQVLAAEKGKNIASDLKTVSVSVEIKPEDVDKMIDALLGGGSLTKSLSTIGQYFIPKANDARNLLERVRTDAPFLSMFPINIVESGGAPVARVGSIDEDTEGRLHMQIGQTINFYQPFLGHALAKLNERYAPTADQILDALCESPLFSETRSDLLREGLLAYQQGDFVKSIHVLVPQVEHMLRHLSGRLGIPARKTVRNHPGITDAKNMNDVLSDERIREKLTEDVWRYLTVLYVDRRGLNLRNDLAHGLIPANGFKKHIADRVFHSLLVLSLMRAPRKNPEGGGERS